MRNLFDQYTQPENRLTHALVTALTEDGRLLKRFVHFVTGKSAPKGAALDIVEQSFPGEAPRSEEEAEKRGLPDACIYQYDCWALVIESKVAAKLTYDQLRRHEKTAERRGFKRVAVLAIDTERPARPLPNLWLFRSWAEIYAWLVKESAKSEWARRVAEYFVAAEKRFVGEGYPVEGTLTTFSGIPFGIDEPYNYPEAKRLLKLAMDELRNNRHLVRQMGIVPHGGGRGSITGREGSAVWDFLQLQGLKKGEAFTKLPHLTLAVEVDRLLVMVTVPHGIRSEYRRRLVELGGDGFQALFSNLNTGLLQALRKSKGANPWVVVVQRRYSSQRAAAVLDARIEYNLQTAFPRKHSKTVVKTQPQWLQATYDALCNKRSNLQIAVGASFPYRSCAAIKSPRIVDDIARTWQACKPLIDAMRR